MFELTTENFDTDKVAYIKYYKDVFDPIRDGVKNFLELGIYHGGSLQMWEKYFTNAQVVGLDLDKIEVPNGGRVKVYQGDQSDVEMLKKISAENAPDGFDIIIDDASHFGKETFISFIYLFKNSLKSGGIYVIEDWATGFWPHFPDGRNITLDEHHVSQHLHNNTDYKFKQKGFMNSGPYFSKRKFQSHEYGMVGVVKQIIDELAIEAATNQYTNKKEAYSSVIDKILFCGGQVFIFKR